MNHTEAVSRGAVERYLLQQLSASESEEFELHFFDCSECAKELRAGAILEDNIRAVVLDEERGAELASRKASSLAEAKQPVWARLWRRPWILAPTLAALALAAVTGYQALVVIPDLRSQLHNVLLPQAVVAFALPPSARGDARTLEIPKGAMFYAIYMDAPGNQLFDGYVCSVQDESGSTRFVARLPAPPPGKPIQILIARSLLPAGRYNVVIRNAAQGNIPEAELAQYALVLKLD